MTKSCSKCQDRDEKIWDLEFTINLLKQEIELLNRKISSMYEAAADEQSVRLRERYDAAMQREIDELSELEIE
jgi:uncharacterized protein YlxW (UPF0749 family)